MKHVSTFSDYIARLRELIHWNSANILPADKVSLAENERPFNELACGLFQLQFANNAAYRRLCDARNITPDLVLDWREIPAVPTAAFKELEMTSLSVADRIAVFYSSGTTAHRPSRHFHNAESLALYEASLVPWFAKHLFPGVQKIELPLHILGNKRGSPISWGPGEMPLPFCILTPPPASAPHSSLVHMLETLRRECGSAKSAFTGAVTDGAWMLNLDETIAIFRDATAANCPIAVLGTAFNFVHLLDYLSEANICRHLPSGSRILETGGYKGRSRSLSKAELHALITKFLGIPATHIVAEYGMSELSSQAYDHTISSPEFRVSSSAVENSDATGNPQTAKRIFHFPPWARVQIISPETGREVGEGETGLIRVYDLANVRSVMAVQTEDLGVRRGSGFELLGRALTAEPRGCSLMTV